MVNGCGPAFQIARLQGFGIGQVAIGDLHRPVGSRRKPQASAIGIELAEIYGLAIFVRLRPAKYRTLELESPGGHPCRKDAMCDVCRIMPVMAERRSRVL